MDSSATDAPMPTPDAPPILSDGSVEAGMPPVGEVYAQSSDTLYKLEPFSKVVTKIGLFDCVQLSQNLLCGGPCGDGMWDIALDKNGQMYGSVMKLDNALPPNQTGEIVKIDKATAHCTVLQQSMQQYPNSLSFVPAGTIDPVNETLVGYVNDQYVKIDTSTGVMTTIGSLNPNSTGSTWYSSGDVVSIIMGKTYLTAKPVMDPAYSGTDTMLEIDPVTGKALKVLGDTGFPKLWGLGFWAGTAYGFSATGQLCSIDVMTGIGTPIPIMGGGAVFWGAGNTTAAPTMPPK
jgi:hypothetical protein